MASLPTDFLNESTNLQVDDAEVDIQVLKADGRVVPFHAKKIYEAIESGAFLSEQNSKRLQITMWMLSWHWS